MIEHGYRDAMTSTARRTTRRVEAQRAFHATGQALLVRNDRKHLDRALNTAIPPVQASPRRIGRRTRLARNCTNGRRERALINSKNVVVRLVVHQS